MDARGVTTFQATRMARTLKAVAVTLNRHYPGRLHELVLLDLPIMLRGLVVAVKGIVHPSTRDKIQIYNTRTVQPVALQVAIEAARNPLPQK